MQIGDHLVSKTVKNGWINLACIMQRFELRAACGAVFG